MRISQLKEGFKKLNQSLARAGLKRIVCPRCHLAMWYEEQPPNKCERCGGKIKKKRRKKCKDM